MTLDPATTGTTGTIAKPGIAPGIPHNLLFINIFSPVT